jgi:DNA-binding IclR family transcriptional regulator
MSEKTVAAVARALMILDCFEGEKDTLRLKDIAEKTGLYKSTILRLAGTLEHFGYLRHQDDGTYMLGPTLWRLGSLYRQRFDFAAQIRPVLKRLSDATTESASFYVRDGDTRVCLLRQNGPQAIRHHLDEGAHLTLDAGAAGHLIRAYTDGTGPKASRILREGHAVSLGERDPDTASIAVPVMASNGKFAGALVVSGLRSRFNAEARERAITLAKKSAEELGPGIIM